MKMTLPFLLLGCLLVAGCQSTPDKRIAKDPEAFAAMDPAVRDKIRAGEVAVGFTEEQVLLAKGKPDRVGRRTTVDGEQVVWTYERSSGGLGFGVGIGGGSGGFGGGVGIGTRSDPVDVSLRVIFEQGVVSAVENYGR